MLQQATLCIPQRMLFLSMLLIKSVRRHQLVMLLGTYRISVLFHDSFPPPYDLFSFDAKGGSWSSELTVLSATSTLAREGCSAKMGCHSRIHF